MDNNEYCMYLRKSRKDTEAGDNSNEDILLRHEKILHECAERHGLVIGRIYREVVSGDSIESRPAVKELLSDVRNGKWKGVLVVEIERLARGDTSDQGTMAKAFKYSGTLIVTPSKIYDPNNEFDEEYFEFGLFMSRREYNTIKRRLSRGREASAKDGNYIGSVTPYGYDKEKLKGEKGFKLIPNQKESEIVKMIFSLYAYGEAQEDGTFARCGSTVICDKLNNMNIKTKYEKEWLPCVILDVLKNPVYIGLIKRNFRNATKEFDTNGNIVVKRKRDRNNMELVKGKHEPLIDIEIWDKVQDCLDNNPVKTIPGTKSMKNPLSSIIICGVCGKKMIRRPHHNGTEDSLICPRSGCANVGSRLQDVEIELMEGMKKWLTNYQLSTENGNVKGLDLDAQIKINIERRESILIEMNKIKSQIENTYDLLEQKIYTVDIFRQRQTGLEQRHSVSETQLKEINKAIEADEKRKFDIDEFIPKVEHIIKVYTQTNDVMLKNQLLSEILEKVIYMKKERGQKGVDNRHLISLTLFPKLPNQHH